MKDEKAKYLIIDAKDIKKQLYNMKREYGFNDWFNVYTLDKIINAKKIFEKYNIPEEFQKIIIKINIPFFIITEAEEYTMGFAFDLTGRKIEKKNNIKYITATNKPFLYDNQIFENTIKFKAQLTYAKFDDVINFLIQLDNNDYLKSYLESIKEFFGISININSLIDAWNQEKDVKKALKLYKKTYNRS